MTYIRKRRSFLLSLVHERRHRLARDVLDVPGTFLSLAADCRHAGIYCDAFGDNEMALCAGVPTFLVGELIVGIGC